MTLYLNQSSAAMQIKLGYVYLAVPISGVLMGFYAVMDMLGVRPAESPQPP